MTAHRDFAPVLIAQSMEDDKRWLLQELQLHTGIEERTISRILREDLHMHKVASKWVPHALTEVDKWRRYETWRDTNKKETIC